jgi:hypothetical protein
MHYRRKHRRELGKRGKSSDWSYPQVQKGDSAQSRYGTSRRVAAVRDAVRDYFRGDVEAFRDIQSAVLEGDRDRLVESSVRVSVAHDMVRLSEVWPH